MFITNPDQSRKCPELSLSDFKRAFNTKKPTPLSFYSLNEEDILIPTQGEITQEDAFHHAHEMMSKELKGLSDLSHTKHINEGSYG